MDNAVAVRLSEALQRLAPDGHVERLVSEAAGSVDVRARVEGLIADVAAASTLECSLLTVALQESVPETLLGRREGEPVFAVVNAQSSRLVRLRGVAPAMAAWAVQAWAVGLGLADWDALGPAAGEAAASVPDRRPGTGGPAASSGRTLSPPSGAGPGPRRSGRRVRLVTFGLLFVAAAAGGGVAAAVAFHGHSTPRRTANTAALSQHLSRRQAGRRARPSARTTPTAHESARASTQPTAPSSTSRLGGVAIVTPNGGPAVTFAGPGSVPYQPVTSLADGTRVSVRCTLYGATRAASGLSLWADTPNGWISQSDLSNGGLGPLAPACQGSLADPRRGGSDPSPDTGPFPIYSAGAVVAIRTAPRTGAATVTTVPDGTLVTFTCYMTGPQVSAPGGYGHNHLWERIANPVAGYIPDALVNDHSARPNVPHC
jgi:hypothetical protein